MRSIRYWVKFDRDPRPELVVAKTLAEFHETLDRLVHQRGDMPGVDDKGLLPLTRGAREGRSRREPPGQ